MGVLHHAEVERAVAVHAEVDGIHMVNVLPYGRIEVVGDVYLTVLY